MCLFLKKNMQSQGKRTIYLCVILTNYPSSYLYHIPIIFKVSLYFMSILQHGNDFCLVRTY